MIEAELVPSLQRIQFNVTLTVAPGRQIPSPGEISKILNESLEPHIGFKVIGGKYVSFEGKNC
jgi:hypothetical protein